MLKKVYLAASWKRQGAMGLIRSALHQQGDFLVVSRWLDAPYIKHEDPGGGHKSAIADVTDIENSDILVIDAEYPSTKGGMWWEMGYAYARGKSVITVGPNEMLFCKIAHLHFDTWQGFLDGIGKYSARMMP